MTAPPPLLHRSEERLSAPCTVAAQEAQGETRQASLLKSVSEPGSRLVALHASCERCKAG